MAVKVFVILCFCAAVLLKTTESKNWALLVAGSNGYDNYRHQADICHAYHIMRNHGIPAENIVTMMYDDIAYNEENPIQGNVINQPDGPNVYPGVVIDYKEKDVSPDVFLAVLKGDKARVQELTGKDGKVIASGPDDHVFVNFADHGAHGLLAFPVDVLYAKDLEKTLKQMHKKRSYKKLVFYVEACESGSMFAKKLPKNISVFASTAANPDQSSYACYYDEKRDTYLGDVYSVNWMQDSDKENLKTETLQKQFKITKKETNTSQVMEYGDLSISEMVVAEFQGNAVSNVSVPVSPRHPTLDAVPAPDVPLKRLQYKLQAAAGPEQKRQIAQKINELMERHSAINLLFKDIVGFLQGTPQGGLGMESQVLLFSSELQLSYTDLLIERRPITQWECYEGAVEKLKEHCPEMRLPQEYHALRQLYLLVNLCERGYQVDKIHDAIRDASVQQPQLCGIM